MYSRDYVLIVFRKTPLKLTYICIYIYVYIYIYIHMYMYMNMSQDTKSYLTDVNEVILWWHPMASPNSIDLSNLLIVTRFGTNNIAGDMWRLYHTIYLMGIVTSLHLVVTQKVSCRNKWDEMNTSWHGEAFRITVTFSKRIPRCWGMYSHKGGKDDNAELWCFIWCCLNYTVNRAIDLIVIQDVMMIM